MNANTDLKNYLKNNLNPTCYALMQHLHNEAGRISALAEISINKLPDNVLCLVIAFLKNLSREEISEYVNRTNNEGKNIFFFCRDIGLLKFIIEYVHDINARCNNGSTALITICDRFIKPDDVEIIELLLNNDADVNARCAHGWTPLINCCSESSPSSRCPNDNFENVVELLISRGACVFLKAQGSEMKAYDFVNDATLLSEEFAQLLRGEISMSHTKSAANV